jgi:ribosome-associated translation inhibitor RaiA
MDKLQIIWGDLDRTEAIEQHIFEKAEKVLTFAPTATTYLVNLKTINPTQSAGVKSFAVNMELRLPNKQDVRSEKEGKDLYQVVTETQQAILTQLKSKKDQKLI